MNKKKNNKPDVFIRLLRKPNDEWNSIVKYVCYNFERRRERKKHKMRKIKVKVINKPNVFPDGLQLLFFYFASKANQQQQQQKSTWK